MLHSFYDLCHHKGVHAFWKQKQCLDSSMKMSAFSVLPETTRNRGVKLNSDRITTLRVSGVLEERVTVLNGDFQLNV